METKDLVNSIDLKKFYDNLSYDDRRSLARIITHENRKSYLEAERAAQDLFITYCNRLKDDANPGIPAEIGAVAQLASSLVEMRNCSY